LLRYPPFSGKNDEKIMEKVAKGTYSFDSEEWDETSKEAKDLIRKMLQFDPSTSSISQSQANATLQSSA
jgi:calcium-dependent protein kinase